MLIAVVFSCLFLGTVIPGCAAPPPCGASALTRRLRPRAVWRTAGPQLMCVKRGPAVAAVPCALRRGGRYGQILAWGQYAMPMLLTGAVLAPSGLVDNALLGVTVPLGFEGGHGTAAGLRQTFVDLEYPEGADLALCAATVGLLSGVIFGTVAINWAIRRGHTARGRDGGGADQGGSVQRGGDFNGVYAPEGRPSAGLQTVSVDSLDSMALHVSVVGLALLFGYAVKRGLLAIEASSEQLTEIRFFSAFPLFPFAMFGGILIQLVADRTLGACPLRRPRGRRVARPRTRAAPGTIDRPTMERISGSAAQTPPRCGAC